jgi:hypothetical protein
LDPAIKFDPSFEPEVRPLSRSKSTVSPPVTPSSPSSGKSGKQPSSSALQSPAGRTIETQFDDETTVTPRSFDQEDFKDDFDDKFPHSSNTNQPSPKGSPKLKTGGVSTRTAPQMCYTQPSFLDHYFAKDLVQSRSASQKIENHHNDGYQHGIHPMESLSASYDDYERTMNNLGHILSQTTLRPSSQRKKSATKRNNGF